jgi:glc operon protein GlcG
MGYWVDLQITGMAGGVPIVLNQKVIGGMGVSGLSEEEDEQLVQTTLARCFS